MVHDKIKMLNISKYVMDCLTTSFENILLTVHCAPFFQACEKKKGFQKYNGQSWHPFFNLPVSKTKNFIHGCIFYNSILLLFSNLSCPIPLQPVLLMVQHVANWVTLFPRSQHSPPPPPSPRTLRGAKIFLEIIFRFVA